MFPVPNAWIVDLKARIKAIWVDKTTECCDVLNEEETEYLGSKLVQELLTRREQLNVFHDDMFPSEVNNMAGIMSLALDYTCDILGRSRVTSSNCQTTLLHGCKREFYRLFKAMEEAEKVAEFINPIAHYFNQTQMDWSNAHPFQQYPSPVSITTTGTTVSWTPSTTTGTTVSWIPSTTIPAGTTAVNWTPSYTASAIGKITSTLK
jgi:hypothetical protein